MALFLHFRQVFFVCFYHDSQTYHTLDKLLASLSLIFLISELEIILSQSPRNVRIR